MITDLFSHKIHSSGDEWPDKLVEIAFLFSEFDGAVYDRRGIEDRLSRISPRSAFVARDRSKFRDEISAYPAYLGLFFLTPSSSGWVLQLSHTARRLLVREEPDVDSFMRLQLTLFQYPNGMGVAYKSGTNEIRIQSNSRDRTIEMIRSGIHLSPMRLIVKALVADSGLRGVELAQSFVTYREVFALANTRSINSQACPSSSATIQALEQIRLGAISAPNHFESRFHILRHTGLFTLENGGIRPRATANEQDKVLLLSQLKAIELTTEQFNGFDQTVDEAGLREVVAQAGWGRYFDAVTTLSPEKVALLSTDLLNEQGSLGPTPPTSLRSSNQNQYTSPSPSVFPLEERGDNLPTPTSPHRVSEFADPEVTRIRRQRRNLEHKRLIDLMYERLRWLGAVPLDNPHIDLYANIPGDGAYLFEMKSEGVDILSQIRKGISQLYEYRYRYKDVVNPNVVLCIVLPRFPSEEPWLEKYLVEDRNITFCWFDDRGTFHVPSSCQDKLNELISTDGSN